MPTAKPRVMVTLDPEAFALLSSLGEQTGQSLSSIVNKLLGAHIADLSEYDHWLRQLPDGPVKARGKYILHSYGPDTLVDAIKQIDPTYETYSEKFERGVRDLNPTKGRSGTTSKAKARK